MWELGHKEGWAPKNWCFWTMVLEKTLESPLDCKIKPANPKGNQSWIFIGRTETEAQYFGHLMWRASSLEKSLMLGKIKGRRRRGWQRMKWVDGITDSTDMSLLKLQEIVKERGAWHVAVHRVTKSQIQLSDWTTTPGALPNPGIKRLSLASSALAGRFFFFFLPSAPPGKPRKPRVRERRG